MVTLQMRYRAAKSFWQMELNADAITLLGVEVSDDAWILRLRG